MKYLLVGVLLVVAGAGVAVTQTDTTTTRPDYPDTTTQEPAIQDDMVKRAVICSGVSNHEPTDSLTMIPPTMNKVFFFTEIAGLEGKTITHRWLKDGAKVADVRISVATNRYRCHSSRSVAGKSGNWSVQVLGEDGEKLVERSFTVGNPNGQTPIGRT
jgi:hypothetical protein